MTDLTSPVIDTGTLPWMPLSAGVEVRLLRLEGEERSLQLKVEPGVLMAPHRHEGAVNAYGLQGYRRLGTGEIAGPGSYVYEPAGNCDSWEAVGDEPCVVQISMAGRLTEVASGKSTDTSGLRERYLAWCAETGNPAVAIGARD